MILSEIPPIPDHPADSTRKACKTCGTVFTLRAPNQQYCTTECRPMHSAPKAEKVCPVCKEPFMAKRNQTFCSVECQKRNDALKYIPRARVEKTCPICLQRFQAKSHQLYCSEECREKSHELRQAQLHKPISTRPLNKEEST